MEQRRIPCNFDENVIFYDFSTYFTKLCLFKLETNSCTSAVCNPSGEANSHNPRVVYQNQLLFLWKSLNCARSPCINIYKMLSFLFDLREITVFLI